MIDLSWCRDLVPALALEVDGVPAAFFDGPGGTQVPARVIEAMSDYLTGANANTHGGFLTSRRTDELITRARAAVASLLGAGDTHDVAFGANMTTLNFALARAIGRTLSPGDEVLITDLDHEANRAPWLTLSRYGVAVRSVPVVPGECRLDMEAMERMITDRTRVVAFGYASNAVGTVTDVHRILKCAKAVGALTVIDAVHYVAHGLIDMSELNCDFLLFSAYKLFGPHIGVLCARNDSLQALDTDRVRCQSDRPPYSIETGTLNHEGIAGTIAALEFVAQLGGEPIPELSRRELVRGMEAIEAGEKAVGDRFAEGLSGIAGVRMYGPPPGHRRVPTYAFTVDGLHPDTVARELGARGLFTWSGHFYAQTLIEQLGLGETGGVVRVGIAPYNTAQEVDRLVSAVESLAASGAVGA